MASFEAGLPQHAYGELSMLMLYLFKIEVFDLDFQYTYAIDRVVIADTREDRRLLIGKQFGAHNGSIVRRSVLLAPEG